MSINYWLMKSEPSEFGIEDLKKEPRKRAHWDGVRNYQARNFMRQMNVGDLAFFYHSNHKPPGIVGVMKIVKQAYTDFTAFDPKDPHYDAKSSPDRPRWEMVDVQFVEQYPHMISLDQLREQKKLTEMALLRKGNRLSIMPVSPAQWQTIEKMV